MARKIWWQKNEVTCPAESRVGKLGHLDVGANFSISFLNSIQVLNRSVFKGTNKICKSRFILSHLVTEDSLLTMIGFLPLTISFLGLFFRWPVCWDLSFKWSSCWDSCLSWLLLEFSSQISQVLLRVSLLPEYLTRQTLLFQHCLTYIDLWKKHTILSLYLQKNASQPSLFILASLWRTWAFLFFSLPVSIDCILSLT